MGDVLNQQQPNSLIDLRKYFKIRCIITTSPASTAELETILQQSLTQLPGNTPTRTGKSATLLAAIHPDAQALQGETYTNSDGNAEIIIPYTFEPILGITTLEHLSVFTFVQLDTTTLAADLNLLLPPSLEGMMGNIQQELVIANSQVVSLIKERAASGTTTIDENHTHSYDGLDSNGSGYTAYASHPQEPNIRHRHTIVNGKVQTAQSLCWMPDTRQNASDPYPEGSCEALYGHPGAPPHIHQLETVWVLVNNVQDFRIRDEIESLLRTVGAQLRHTPSGEE